MACLQKTQVHINHCRMSIAHFFYWNSIKTELPFNVFDIFFFQWRHPSSQPSVENSPRAKNKSHKSQHSSTVNNKKATRYFNNKTTRCFKNTKINFKIHQHGFVSGERWVRIKMCWENIFIKSCFVQAKCRFWNYGGVGQEGEGRARGEEGLEKIWNVKKLRSKGGEGSVGGRKHRFGWKDGLARQGLGFRGQHSFFIFRKLKTVSFLYV